MPTVLTIAGSDPSGNAGIQADLKVFEAFSVKGLSAITAVTAQSNEKVISINPVAGDILSQQLYSASKNQDIAVVKIGMIGSAGNVRTIIMFLKNLKAPNIVIDPVLSSSSGTPLLEANTLPLFKNELLPLATVITPNTDEAGVLAGMNVWNIGTMKEAAREIYNETLSLRKIPPGGFAVLVKGGHLQGDAIDILFDGEEFTEFHAKRITGKKARGTGCRLSSAIAAELANGKKIKDAVSEAKKYVENYISSL